MAGLKVGFIGAGRVARIVLGGLKKAGSMPAKLVASDSNADVLKRMKSAFPEIHTALNNNREAAAQDLVFLGLHPPALPGTLAEIKDCLMPGAIDYPFGGRRGLESDVGFDIAPAGVFLIGAGAPLAENYRLAA